VSGPHAGMSHNFVSVMTQWENAVVERRFDLYFGAFCLGNARAHCGGDEENTT
jgi:hypothetical protein